MEIVISKIVAECIWYLLKAEQIVRAIKLIQHETGASLTDANKIRKAIAELPIEKLVHVRGVDVPGKGECVAAMILDYRDAAILFGLVPVGFSHVAVPDCASCDAECSRRGTVGVCDCQ